MRWNLEKSYIEYEGDVVNDLPNGNGLMVEYDYDGNFIESYEGYFEDGILIKGKVNVTFDTGAKYVGEMSNETFNGIGTYTRPNGESWTGLWVDGERVDSPESDIIPNAIKINPLGDIHLVYIEDFSTYEGLGAPINCERIDIISTQRMREVSDYFGVTIVGYIDKYAYQNEIINNGIMCDLSGYEYLPGPCMLCGFENNDYAPLHYDDAERIYDFLLQNIVKN